MCATPRRAGGEEKKTRDCFAPRRAAASAAPASVPYAPPAPTMWLHFALIQTHSPPIPTGSQRARPAHRRRARARRGGRRLRGRRRRGCMPEGSVHCIVAGEREGWMEGEWVGVWRRPRCTPIPPPPNFPLHQTPPSLIRPTSTSSSSPSCAPTSSPPLPPPTGGPASTARASWRRRWLMNSPPSSTRGAPARPTPRKDAPTSSCLWGCRAPAKRRRAASLPTFMRAKGSNPPWCVPTRSVLARSINSNRMRPKPASRSMGHTRRLIPRRSRRRASKNSRPKNGTSSSWTRRGGTSRRRRCLRRCGR